MKTISGNILFIITQLLYAVWFLSFLFGTPPLWVHIAGGIATLLFLWRIERGDD